MRQLVLLSGRSGTGKTSVAAGLALLASQSSRVVLVDAAVDVANLELLVTTQRTDRNVVGGSQIATIDPLRCTSCGRCVEVCRFDAVIAEPQYRVDPLACEGCAACCFQCPSGAIRVGESTSGLWFRSDTPRGPLFHGHLYPGQENEGDLVTIIRQAASIWGAENRTDYVIIDGPSGIGYPALAAAVGTNLALLVIEPSRSATRHLERILNYCAHVAVPAAVVINRYDLDPKGADALVSYCREHGVPVAGRVPCDVLATPAMAQGQPMNRVQEAATSQELGLIWRSVRDLLS